MKVSLIGNIKANMAPHDYNDYNPETDSNARVLLREGENDISAERKINNVFPVYRDRAGKMVPEFNGYLDLTRGLDWTVVFTEERVIFWSPYTIGPYGGTKIKPGKAIGGHIKYSWIHELLVTNDDVTNQIVLVADPNSAFETMCYIEAENDTLAYILEEITKRTKTKRKDEPGIDTIVFEHLDKVSAYDWNGEVNEMHIIFSDKSSTIKTRPDQEQLQKQYDRWERKRAERSARQNTAKQEPPASCSKCGSPVKPGTKFCAKCGNAL